MEVELKTAYELYSYVVSEKELADIFALVDNKVWILEDDIYDFDVGSEDNISNCKYSIPDYREIGEVFARLIEDCYEEEQVFIGIKEVYSSWIVEKILNFNSDMYYQSRDYLAVCYKEGMILSD